MRVNNIQNYGRSEIVTTNRKQGTNNQVNFQAKVIKPLLPEEVINHFDINMSTAVKYKGAPVYTPAPESIGEKLSKFFHKLEVDWGTHVDPSQPKTKY